MRRRRKNIWSTTTTPVRGILSVFVTMAFFIVALWGVAAIVTLIVG